MQIWGNIFFCHTQTIWFFSTRSQQIIFFLWPSTRIECTECTWKTEYQSQGSFTWTHLQLHLKYLLLMDYSTTALLPILPCEDSVTNSVIDTVTNTNPGMYLPLYYHLCQGGDGTAGAYPPICLFDCEQNNLKILKRSLMQFSGNVDNGLRNR